MRTLLAIVLCVYPAALFAGFAEAPAFSAQGGGLAITFTVDDTTDVEVGIIDGRGRVIRHLAAGVLGGAYDPPPPLVPGLSQSIEWDGTDDYGRPALNGPYSARVRLGVAPAFERSISTRVFSAAYAFAYGPGNIAPTGDFLDTTHPVFDTIRTSGKRRPDLDMIVEDETEEVVFKVYSYGRVHYARVDGRSGALIGIITNLAFLSGDWYWWGEASLSWSGQYLHHDETNTEAGHVPHHLRFLYPSGLAAPFSALGTNHVDSFNVGDMTSRGHAPGPDGSVYLLHYSDLFEQRDYESGPMAVSRIDSAGNVAQREFIVIDGSVSGGVRVDLEGNVYLGARVKPRGQPVPPWVQGRLEGVYDSIYSQAWWGDEMYGSILKFGPSGGSVRVTWGSSYQSAADTARSDLIAGGGRSARSGERALAVAENLVWMYYGYSHVLTHNSYRHGCWCNVTRFDVDRYGRIFLPNSFERQILAIDNSRNGIFRFRDDDVNGLHIGLGHSIAATDRALYVADHFNNQILVFRLSSRDSAVLELPLGIESGLSGNPAWGDPAFTVFPNPAASGARLSFFVPCAARQRLPVSLRVFDLKSRCVRDLFGGSVEGRRYYSVAWDGRDGRGEKAGNGCYLARLKIGPQVKTRKILVME